MSLKTRKTKLRKQTSQLCNLKSELIFLMKALQSTKLDLNYSISKRNSQFHFDNDQSYQMRVGIWMLSQQDKGKP